MSDTLYIIANHNLHEQKKLFGETLDPVGFMRENIKGKSDISRCDHGDWFLINGECSFIEGHYIDGTGKMVVVTCHMKRYIENNKVPNQFECQNCGDRIMDRDLTEFLLCKQCSSIEVALRE